MIKMTISLTGKKIYKLAFGWEIHTINNEDTFIYKNRITKGNNSFDVSGGWCGRFRIAFS